MMSSSPFEESLFADLVAEHKKHSWTYRNRFFAQCLPHECACFVLREVLLECVMGGDETIPERPQGRCIGLSYDHHCDRHEASREAECSMEGVGVNAG